MALVSRIEVLRACLAQRFDAAEYGELQLLETVVAAVGGTPPVEPTVIGLSPSSAVLGGPDLVLSVYGSGFTAATVILFNGGEEPTTVRSDVEVTTVVKPSTATLAVTVPVSVVGAAQSVDFTFTEETTARRRR